jgi:hypothetical protein
VAAFVAFFAHPKNGLQTHENAVFGRFDGANTRRPRAGARRDDLSAQNKPQNRPKNRVFHIFLKK